MNLVGCLYAWKSSLPLSSRTRAIHSLLMLDLPKEEEAPDWDVAVYCNG